MLKMLKSRNARTVPSRLTWPSTIESDGTEEFATTISVNSCSVLPETQFVWTRLRVYTTHVLFEGGSLPPMGATGERQEFGIKQPLGAPLLTFPRGYPMKTFLQRDISVG